MSKPSMTPLQAFRAFVDTLDRDRFKVEIDTDFDQDLLVYKISESGRGEITITFWRDDESPDILHDGDVLVLY